MSATGTGTGEKADYYGTTPLLKSTITIFLEPGQTIRIVIADPDKVEWNDGEIDFSPAIVQELLISNGPMAN